MGVVFGFFGLPLLEKSKEMFYDETIGYAHTMNHICGEGSGGRGRGHGG